MKESIEELKAIIAGAPVGATHYDVHYYRYSGDEAQSAPSKRFEWEFVSDGSAGLELTRSLSDIEEIIKLREFIAGLQLSVSDEVKANELLGVDNGY